MLVVRTDASATIGIGHAMRCLAVAEAWIELGGQVTFAMHEVPDSVADRIRREGVRIERVQTIADEIALIGDLGARHAVIDGYHLGAAHQAAIASTGVRLLVIDDRGETATRYATLVLNQNAYATPALYPDLPADLLIGTAYALLRREFRVPAAARTMRATATRVLVSFGGADTAKLTPRAIEALAPIEGLTVVVVAGPTNPDAASLVSPASARAEIQIMSAVDDMAAHMHRAELAVVAAGSTCWELAACGVPMIAIAVADNQRGIAASITELGIGISLDVNAGVDELRAHVLRLVGDLASRAQMSRRGLELIDGRGAIRVCAALRGAP